MTNRPWQQVVERWAHVAVDYLREYFADRGGPVILAQIENAYPLPFGDQDYVNWCGELAARLGVRIPWMMAGDTAAPGTILACIGCNCYDDGFVARHRTAQSAYPLVWAEDWSWYQVWGQAPGRRSASDQAYVLALWLAAGGAYHSFYMFYGGNSFGNTQASGLPMMYTNDALLHSNTLPNEPKFSHLAALLSTIIGYAPRLLAQSAPEPQALLYWCVWHARPQRGPCWVYGLPGAWYAHGASSSCAGV